MAVPQPDWQRLASAIVARRAELGMTQVGVATAGGISLDRIQALEGAKRTSYRKNTLAALERALQWEPGSVQAVLAGGDPLPLSGVQAKMALTRDLVLQALNQLPTSDLRELVATSLRDHEAEAGMAGGQPDDPHLRRLLELWPHMREAQRRGVVAMLEEMVSESVETGRKPDHAQERRTG